MCEQPRTLILPVESEDLLFEDLAVTYFLVYLREFEDIRFSVRVRIRGPSNLLFLVDYIK